MKKLAILLIVTLVTSQAHAEPASSRRAHPSWVDDGSWGWFLVATSIFVGTTVTAVGLALDCEDGQNSCTRASSLAIWGGLGIAAVGSVLGLAVVANHTEPPRTAFRQRAPSVCTEHVTRDAARPALGVLRCEGPWCRGANRKWEW